MTVRHLYRCVTCAANEERRAGTLNDKPLIPDYPCLLCGGEMRRVWTPPNLPSAAVPTRYSKGMR